MKSLMTAVLATVMSVGAVAAQVPMTERTEQLQLKPRRVPGLLGYGFDLAEYSGETSSRSFSFRALGRAISRDSATTKFKVQSPSIPALEADCAGGQRRTYFVTHKVQREIKGAYCPHYSHRDPDSKAELVDVSRGRVQGDGLAVQPFGFFGRGGHRLNGPLDLAPAFGDDLPLFQCNGLAEFLSPLAHDLHSSVQYGVSFV